MKKILLTTTTFSMIAFSLIISLNAEAATYSYDYGNGFTSYSGDINGFSYDHDNGFTSYSGDINGSSYSYGNGFTTYDLR